MNYSPNPEVNATIEALLAIGCPPIPVAPIQDPHKSGCHQVDFSQSYQLTFYINEDGKEVSARSYCLDDRLKKVNGQNDPSTGEPIKNWDDRGVYCPLTSDLKPVPKFTGKNPSYLTKYGRPRICKHGKFQNRIPTEQELKEFFCNPDTGVGTLGGHGGVDWIDFDAKNYESQEICDSSVQEVIKKNALTTSWIEKTGSGGYRIAVKPKQHPTFTNFALTPGGKHIGEALWEGRFTVLAPSIHPNGKHYQRLGWGEPVEIESLESIEIYPSKDEIENKERSSKTAKKKEANPDYGKASNATDNPWDIRNFAHYFEGYYEKEGWGYAKCPHHNGTSMRSFRVHLATGAYRVLCGCNTKDVYKSGLTFAESFGFTVQSKSNFINKDVWELKFGLPKLLKQLTNKITKQFRGFCKKAKNLKLEKKNWQASKLITPFDIQPPDVYKNEGSPLLMYRQGDMPEIWKAAKKQGYKAVYDSSLMGDGKSEQAGRQRVENWFDKISDSGKEKLYYASQSGRNTTAPALERWTPLAVRHDGLSDRPEKRTGGNNPFIERTKPGETPTYHSNCDKTKYHHIFAEKNLGFKTSRSLGKSIDSHPICNLCSNLDDCKVGSGIAGSGFKDEMKESLKARRIKGTLSAFPSTHDFRVIGFVDEAAVTIQKTRDVKVQLRDVTKSFYNLYKSDKETYAQFEFISGILDIYLKEEKPPLYGYDLQTIKNWFGERVKTPEFYKAIEKLREHLSTQIGTEIGEIANFGVLTELTVSETLSLNWLLPFCQVLSGEKSGSIRIQDRSIIVTLVNDDDINIIRSWEFGVFLDATGDRDELAHVLGYDKSEILWVMQAPPEGMFNNAKVVQVRGLGNCGKERREGLQKRIEKVGETTIQWASGNLKNAKLDKLIGKPEEIFKDGFDPQKVSFIRHKKYKKPGDLYYFGGANGHRGSNAAQNCQMLIMEGTPNENMGAALAQYHAIYDEDCTLDDEDFQNWYNKRIIGEVCQTTGRTRSSRRMHQTIPVIVLSDANLSGLSSQYGIDINQIDAFDVTPEAGTRTQQSFWKILNAFNTCRESGTKLTQDNISALAGCSQQLVSKLAIKFEGWKRFKFLLLTLLNNPYNSSGKIPDFDDLTDEQRIIIEDYFIPGLEAIFGAFNDVKTLEDARNITYSLVDVFTDVYDKLGFSGLIKGIRCCPSSIQSWILALIFEDLKFVIDF